MYKANFRLRFTCEFKHLPSHIISEAHQANWSIFSRIPLAIVKYENEMVSACSVFLRFLFSRARHLIKTATAVLLFFAWH